MHDVIVVGGSYAGIAAAMPLARARRTVLVVDAGRRRNRFAAESHGFLGQDGVDPGVIAERGRREVLAYPTVAWLDDEAVSARRDGDTFVVRTRTEEVAARRPALATGVVDHYRPSPACRKAGGGRSSTAPTATATSSTAARWARRRSSEHSFIQRRSSPSGRRVATHDVPWALRALPPRSPPIWRRAAYASSAPAVLAVESGTDGGVTVRVDGGRTVQLAGLFVATLHVRIAGAFADLGCAVETHPMGTCYRTDPTTKETTARGAFACGDAASPMAALPYAVADGFRAGVGAHRAAFPTERTPRATIASAWRATASTRRSPA